MQLELFHLSLAYNTNLFAARNKDGSPLEREDWIRKVFSERIEFFHRGSKYHYIPHQSPIDVTEPLLFGRIGRKVTAEENAPPEEGLEDVRRDSWKASSVVIDPRKHDDGQKLAMQSRKGVGAPFSVLKSLMFHISYNIIDAPYFVEIRPLTDPSGFWDFVEQNEGEITSITLEFIAPNMFGIGDRMDEEWEDLKANEHAVRATTTIENENGLNPNTERVKKAVDYASKGGGSVSARTRRGKRYNSKKRTRKVSIPDKENGGRRTILEMISSAVRIIFRN